MPIFQLPRDIVFPDPDFAEPDGLLAVGGDLSPKRLLAAYRLGIFPWYSEGEPILWWSPAPRLVLIPEEFHCPKRLARTMRQKVFTVTMDTDFSSVITNCATTRVKSGEGTWITSAMREAYITLHEHGYAHSVECYLEGKLVGGLYGVCIDRIFFGESMFSTVSNASKVALAALVRQCIIRRIKVIDCQMTTAHLLKFGAKEVSRARFQNFLQACIHKGAPQEPWSGEEAALSGPPITKKAQDEP